MDGRRPGRHAAAHRDDAHGARARQRVTRHAGQHRQAAPGLGRAQREPRCHGRGPPNKTQQTQTRPVFGFSIETREPHKPGMLLGRAIETRNAGAAR
eukprot:scaffold960_cov24-Tisochrysis_lutea.AAC.1